MNIPLFVSKRKPSILCRIVATLLVPLQAITLLPVPGLLAAEMVPAPTANAPLAQKVALALQPAATPAPVTVNRTVPKVSSGTAALHFSVPPRDAEFRQVRVFAEPLLPMGETQTTAEENSALAAAVLNFSQRPDPDNLTVLKQFLANHPHSPWRVSLLTNVGILERQGAYWSEALAAWQEAWQLGKGETEPTRRLVADRALAQLAELTARIGRGKDLQTLLNDAGDRDVRGPATEKLVNARASLSLMKTEPTKSFRCGPLAIGRIYASLNPGKALPDDVHNSTCTDHGTSLVMVRDFAKHLGMSFQMARRSPGADIIVPSVVNWKVGHYGAITRKIGDEYLIEDPTFTGSFVVSRQALDQEASGYFVVPDGKLPTGWKTVASAEGQKVWGQGAVPPSTPPTPPCTGMLIGCPLCPDKGKGGGAPGDAGGGGGDDSGGDDGGGGGGGGGGGVSGMGGRSAAVLTLKMPKPRKAKWPNPLSVKMPNPYLQSYRSPYMGMAGYSIDPSRVNLNISDIPLSYSPPRGPQIAFSASYSQRDVASSSTPNYPNLGHQWNFGWVCFVIDDPNNVNTTTYGPGGGTLTYTGYVSTSASTGGNTGYFGNQVLTQAVLQRTSATSYVRVAPDGSQQIFNLADNSVPKRIYMTEFDDAAGNSVKYTYDPVTFRLVSVTDALGQVTTLGYLSNDPTSVNGDYYRVVSVTDPFSRTASLAYDNEGRLASITDTAGFTSSFAYGTGNFITTLTTPYGNTSFVSNDSGPDRSLLVTDPEGGSEFVQFKYNMTPPDNGSAVPSASGLLTQPSYNQYRTAYYWDKKAYAEAPGDYSKAHLMHFMHTSDLLAMSDILESEKLPYSSRVYYNYLGQTNAYTESVTGGNLTTKVAQVMANGSTTQLYQCDYNAQGMPTRFITPGDTNTPARTTTYTYAANGLDPIGIYQENTAGASTDSYSVAADLLASFTYDARGKHLITSTTDPAGQVTSYTYNGFGQMMTITDPQNHVITLGYDGDDDHDGVSDGYLLTVSGPVAGASTSVQYDGFGRPWKVTNLDGDTTTLTYEAVNGSATKTLNRVTQATYADGTTEQIIYDRMQPQWMQDRLGRWTEVVYDAMQRPTTVLDSLGRITQYEWCTCGALETMTDPAGNKTTWIRDEQSRVVNKIYPDNTMETKAYETNTGRVISVTDAKGQRRNFVYNIDNTIQQVNFTTASGGALTPPTPAVSFTYDTAYPRALTMTDGVGTTTYTYDPITAPPALGAGSLASIDGPWANDTISYTYDEMGRIVTRSIDGANNTTTITYDGLGRAHVVNDPLGTTTYTFTGNTRRLDNIAYQNGQTAKFFYYGASGGRLLQEIKNTDAGNNLISQFDYTYDTVGNITRWTQNNSSLANARLFTLGYDATDQLSSASLTDTVSGASLGQESYRFDGAGNRTTSQNGNSVATETANGLNQVTQVGGGGMMRFAGTLSKPGTVTVGGNAATMDSTNTNFQGYANVPANTTTRVHVVATDGNAVVTDNYTDITPSEVTAQTFTYDLNGNTQTVGPAGSPTSTYGWDAANRLISVTQGSNVTTFDYDGHGRRVREKVNGTETRHWVWDGMRLCEERDSGNNVTKRFYDEGEQIAGAAYYATRDHLGSVRELLDSTGAVATGLHARYDYDVYGLRSGNLVTTGAVAADFGFTGHQEFPAIGLIGAPSRFYNPVFGRWINRDPIHEAGGSNLYDYVLGNPVNNVDPLGQDLHLNDTDYLWAMDIPQDLAEKCIKIQNALLDEGIAKIMGSLLESLLLLWDVAGESTVFDAVAGKVESGIDAWVVQQGIDQTPLKGWVTGKQLLLAAKIGDSIRDTGLNNTVNKMGPKLLLRSPLPGAFIRWGIAPR